MEKLKTIWDLEVSLRAFEKVEFEHPVTANEAMKAYKKGDSIVFDVIDSEIIDVDDVYDAR